MRRLPALALACVLAAIVAGCGGGGDGKTTGPPVSDSYGGAAQVIGTGCTFALGAITVDHTSTSDAQTAARQSCEAAARQFLPGESHPGCAAGAFPDCAAVAAGLDSGGTCGAWTRYASTESSAESNALQACQDNLASGADCRTLVSGCSTGFAPLPDYWRFTASPPGNRPPQAAASQSLNGPVGSTWTYTRTQLEAAFSDPDGDTLTYSESSNLWSVASATISSNGLRITANAAGTATISVTATDPGGLSATWRINVTVTRAASRNYGASSVDLSDCRRNADGLAVGLTSNYTSSAAARSRAIDLCVDSGGERSECRHYVNDFGSAYGAGSECIAIAFGRDPSGTGTCGTHHGHGSTENAAQSAALSNCRGAGRSSCILVRNDSGTVLSLCAR